MKRSGKIIITARAPKPVRTEGDPKYPVLNGLFASVEDVEVDVVTDDGERISLCSNVLRGAIKIEPGEPIVAVLEVAPEAIELEAWATLTPACECIPSRGVNGLVNGWTIRNGCTLHHVATLVED